MRDEGLGGGIWNEEMFLGGGAGDISRSDVIPHSKSLTLIPNSC